MKVFFCQILFLFNQRKLVSGLGDMAVSNTIGSNVFDILVGLGVPWAIQTICVSYGSEVSLICKHYTPHCSLCPFQSPPLSVFNLTVDFLLLTSGCHQQPGAGVFSGASSGLCGAHGEKMISPCVLKQR